jgi:hypothetical protein
VAELFDAVQRLHDEDATVVTSVRLSNSLREAVKAAVKAGMDANPNDAMLNAVRDRLEAFTQRLALDLHYERHPDARHAGSEYRAQPTALRLRHNRPRALVVTAFVYRSCAKTRACRTSSTRGVVSGPLPG